MTLGGELIQGLRFAPLAPTGIAFAVGQEIFIAYDAMRGWPDAYPVAIFRLSSSAQVSLNTTIRGV